MAPSETPEKGDELVKTPPYVTAKPDVTYKKLTRGNTEGDLKFIVLATDGRKHLRIRRSFDFISLHVC
jgi:pyruvate dehydrogenase phosphatase